MDIGGLTAVLKIMPQAAHNSQGATHVGEVAGTSTGALYGKAQVQSKKSTGTISKAWANITHRNCSATRMCTTVTQSLHRAYSHRLHVIKAVRAAAVANLALLQGSWRQACTEIVIQALFHVPSFTYMEATDPDHLAMVRLHATCSSSWCKSSKFASSASCLQQLVTQLSSNLGWPQLTQMTHAIQANEFTILGTHYWLRVFGLELACYQRVG